MTERWLLLDDVLNWNYEEYVRESMFRRLLRIHIANIALCCALRRYLNQWIHRFLLVVFVFGSARGWAGMILLQVPLQQPCYDFSFL